MIIELDAASGKAPEFIDGQFTLAARRRAEAYNVIETSEDEVFQTDLYDWYLSQGQANRLLEIQSPFIITYLERKSETDIAHADLLWRYHNQWDRHYDAATVQLHLAKSDFELSLDRRIEYLSRARANASTSTTGVGRQSLQRLLREVSEALDLANIQDDLLQRLKADPRVAPNVRPVVIRDLDGQILSLTEVYSTTT